MEIYPFTCTISSILITYSIDIHGALVIDRRQDSLLRQYRD